VLKREYESNTTAILTIDDVDASKNNSKNDNTESLVINMKVFHIKNKLAATEDKQMMAIETNFESPKNCKKADRYEYR
jgi:hypothetical protein